MSYYGALGASEDPRRDLDDPQRFGFNRFVSGQLAGVRADVAVDGEGNAVESGIRSAGSWRMRSARHDCDVTLSRGNGVSGPPRLQTRWRRTGVRWDARQALRPFRNWYLTRQRAERPRQTLCFVQDLPTLRSVSGTDRETCDRFTGAISAETSCASISPSQTLTSSRRIGRDATSPNRTGADQTASAWIKEIGRAVPVHYQSRSVAVTGNGSRAPRMVTDVRGARNGGAGWCFTTATRATRPMATRVALFDLRDKRLFDDLIGGTESGGGADSILAR
jgi:hypothetical protein